MTKEEFQHRFLMAVNAVRGMTREPPVGPDWLKQRGMEVVECTCGEQTCPGWAMKVPEAPKRYYPQGQMPPQKTLPDKGEVGMLVTRVQNKVILKFQQDVSWIGMGTQEARQLAAGLLHYAAEAEGTIAVQGNETVN